jgi:hypothetical protein
MATCTRKEKYSLEQDKEQDNKKIIEFDYNYQKWNLITSIEKQSLKLTCVTSQKSSKDLNRASNCSTPLLICNIEESNRKQGNWMLKIMGGDIQGKFKHALCKEWFGTSHKRKLALMFL